jgi:predicted small metal-binding protein
MEFEVSCDCGWSFRGPEERVIEETRKHARSVHELEITAEQARAAARPVSPPPSRRDG